MCNEFGGAELSCACLANELAGRGHQIVIFYSGVGADPKKLFMSAQLIETIKLIDLMLEGNLKSVHFQSCITDAKQKIIGSNIDIAIGFILGIQSPIFAHLFYDLDIPLILSARSSTKIPIHSEGEVRSAIIAASFADAVHVQIESFKEEYPNFLQDRMVTIPNYVKLPVLDEPLAFSKREKKILAVGRFVEKQKCFSTLIEAFEKVAKKFPDWELLLCGDGADSELLYELVRRRGLERKIIFPGLVKNLAPYYSISSIFCIPSAYEGFPNVLCEAQGYALPCVGFADCPGVNNLIANGVNGLLAERRNAESLATSLMKLIENEELRKQYGQLSRSMISQYNSSTITDSWENLLQFTISRRYSKRLQRDQVEKIYYELLCYDRFASPIQGFLAQLATLEQQVGLVSFPQRIQRIFLLLYRPAVKFFVLHHAYKLYKRQPSKFFLSSTRRIDLFCMKILSLLGPKIK